MTRQHGQPVEPPQDLRERSFRFALRVLRVVQALPRDTVGFVVGRQLARAGTSIGANIEEAHGSHSRAEFVRRMNIARGSARETLYWLRLTAELGLIPRRRMEEILVESDELVRILVTVVKRLRASEAGEE